MLEVIENEARVSSEVIARQTENQEESVTRLVRNYRADLERFGGLVESRGRFWLNEQQATLVMTYMRNSEIVRGFKIRLVEAFYEAASTRKPLALPDFTNPAEAARAWADAIDQNKVMETKVMEYEDKAKQLTRLTMAAGNYSINEAAKILNTGQKKLFALLRKHKYLTRRNLPYQAYLDRGWFIVRAGTWTDDHGWEHAYQKTFHARNARRRLTVRFRACQAGWRYDDGNSSYTQWSLAGTATRLSG